MSSVFKKHITRYLDADGRQVPSDTPGARKVKELSAKWYGRVPGERRPVPLSTNKATAERMLHKKINQAERVEIHGADPYEAHRKRPLREHLADFEAGLIAKGVTAKQAGQVASRARKVLDGCGFTCWPDVCGSRVEEFLASLRGTAPRPLPPLAIDQQEYTKAELAAAIGRKPSAAVALVRQHRLAAIGNGKARRFPRETVEALRERLGRGRSVQTSNFYLQAVKQFCRWMVRDRRAGDNPLAHLEGGNVRADRRHDRRELEADELRRLLAAARASDRTFRRFTGADRFHLYATACATGFRALSLASLTPESFDLDADAPAVTLAARHVKNRRTKVQPLPADVAELLRDYLAGKPAGQPVWGGKCAANNEAADMLRIDLDAAGIPYAVEGPDGPLFADFHALRHSYLTLGGRAGIDLRTLQELAGHSTPILTARYSHRRLYDLAGAIEKLPSILPTGDEAPNQAAEVIRATGTDGSAAAAAGFSCSPVAQTRAGVRGPTLAAAGTASEAAGTGESENPMRDRGLRVVAGESGSKRGVRPAGFEPATLGLGNRCSIP